MSYERDYSYGGNGDLRGGGSTDRLFVEDGDDSLQGKAGDNDRCDGRTGMATPGRDADRVLTRGILGG